MESLIGEIFNETESHFSIGMRFPIYGNTRTRATKKSVKGKKTRGQQNKQKSSIKEPFISLFTDKKKLLIDCPYLELKIDLINSEPLIWKRLDIVQKYTNRRIIPEFPESTIFEKALSFKIPNIYQSNVEFLREYIKTESRCRWQFKKLMNFWIFKKYSKNLFNTEDPITCCIPEKPLFLYSVKQRGSYVFERSQMKKHFETALKFSEYTIPRPMKPKNPFTNIPFSLSDQIAIIEDLREKQKEMPV
jgi:hypothetical protein